MYGRNCNPNTHRCDRCGVIDPTVALRSFPQVPNSVRSFFTRQPAQDWGVRPGPSSRTTYWGGRSVGDASSAAKGIVAGMLQRHPVLMVSFTYCPYCTKLAAKLDNERISYKKWEIDRSPNKSKIMDEFQRMSGIRTAPQVYVNGRFVGDGSKTTKMLANGKFHALIGRRKRKQTTRRNSRKGGKCGCKNKNSKRKKKR
uniref:Glutaredoxin-2, mitochondrial n=1 Tax=Lygus hesperus TaxID=30085 RepID=A0A0A9X180_LYGHE